MKMAKAESMVLFIWLNVTLCNLRHDCLNLLLGFFKHPFDVPRILKHYWGQIDPTILVRLTQILRFVIHPIFSKRFTALNLTKKSFNECWESKTVK